MIYLSYGMPKSASSFCAQIVRELLKRHADANGLRFLMVRDLLPENPQGAFFVPSPSFGLDDFLRVALEASSDGVCMPVKLHARITPYAKSLIESGAILASASFRHPGDCILSLMDAYRREAADPQRKNRFPGGRDFDSALKACQGSGRVFIEWANVKNVELVYFNDIAANPHGVLERLKRQIGCSISDHEWLDRYLDDKSLIFEFNKGVLDRRLQEFSSRQLGQIEDQCSDMVAFISRYVRSKG